ncbi:MAG TPA: peptide-methionine (S)-S-oxide reductase MsrA [Abditibacteriaceae bacterium]|jgi:peptide-methionine (S)-S-oxide reductase
MKDKKTFSNSLLLAASIILCSALALALVGGLSRAGSTSTPSASQASFNAPKTTMQVPAGKEVATLAAGCFWSMEAMFEQLQGVEKVEPGYAGGTVANPTYERVCEGNTGHAEAVNIVFDPKQISYRQLLQVMLTMRDPTTLNRQGPDAGTNYRSAIFTHSPQQQETAEAAIREVAAAKIWNDPIVTPVTPFINFYQAEEYHRDYYQRHPDVAYSQSVIAPKIEALRSKFKANLKP